MNLIDLIEQIKTKASYLCVGLDTDPARLPSEFPAASEAISEFNRHIIDATKDYCVAYKLNIAFYESQGMAGWRALNETLEAIPDDIYVIADAKRGDIGNTSSMYAKTFFGLYDFDAVTVAPYMGSDSVIPFLNYEDKQVILLAHTSNDGANDFQQLEAYGKPIYQHVIERALEWASPDQMMFVVGATRPHVLKAIRATAPDSFFLVPGVGAQGGDLEAVSRAGLTADCGLLVNSSRAIIYADSGEHFAEAAAEKAREYQQTMSKLLKEAGIV